MFRMLGGEYNLCRNLGDAKIPNFPTNYREIPDFKNRLADAVEKVSGYKTKAYRHYLELAFTHPREDPMFLDVPEDMEFLNRALKDNIFEKVEKGHPRLNRLLNDKRKQLEAKGQEITALTQLSIIYHDLKCDKDLVEAYTITALTLMVWYGDDQAERFRNDWLHRLSLITEAIPDTHLCSILSIQIFKSDGMKLMIETQWKTLPKAKRTYQLLMSMSNTFIEDQRAEENHRKMEKRELKKLQGGIRERYGKGNAAVEQQPPPTHQANAAKGDPKGGKGDGKGKKGKDKGKRNTSELPCYQHNAHHYDPDHCQPCRFTAEQCWYKHVLVSKQEFAKLAKPTPRNSPRQPTPRGSPRDKGNGKGDKGKKGTKNSNPSTSPRGKDGKGTKDTGRALFGDGSRPSYQQICRKGYSCEGYQNKTCPKWHVDDDEIKRVFGMQEDLDKKAKEKASKPGNAGNTPRGKKK